MPLGQPLRYVVVGLVFLGSLFLLGYATLAINAVPWRAAHPLTIRFPGVNRLKTGEDVVIHGFRVGQVERIRYDPDPARAASPIVVSCSLNQEMPLTDRTEFRVRSTGPLGGQFIEVLPRDGKKVDRDWDSFAGSVDEDPLTQLGNLVSENRESFQEMLRSLRQITADVDSGRGVLGRLVDDPALAADFAGGVADLREIARAINSGEGVLGAVIKDQDLRDRFTLAVEDLSAAIRDKDRGIVGMLLNDQEARQELRQTLTEAREAMRDVREIAADVRSGKGVLGRLVSDSELARKLDEIADDVHDIVHKVNAGEGTLGQVVNNTEAWDDLVRLLAVAREAVEDLREQAPINTFANVLFSAF
jgi:phospholipid/cholesterol/gamma-HCH transport system substrate-binding protein